MKLAIAENYKKRKMKEGGNAYAKEDKEMLHSQVKQIKHHAEEMDSVIDKQKHIEPWVVSKMGRTTSDLSDVNHYLDGRLMKRGGELQEQGNEMAIYTNKALNEIHKMGGLRDLGHAWNMVESVSKRKGWNPIDVHVTLEKKMKEGGSTEDFRVDGYMTLSNSGGIEIELDNRGDGLRYRFNNNGNYTEPEETFIGFDDEGEAMFVDGDTVYHLSDFMRAYAKGCMMKAGGRSSKMYYHILEYGDYGNIGYQGVYDTLDGAEKEASRLKDYFPEMDFQIFPSNSMKEPEITTMKRGGEVKEYKSGDVIMFNSTGSKWTIYKILPNLVLYKEFNGKFIQQLSKEAFEEHLKKKEIVIIKSKMKRGGGVESEFTRFKNWFDNYKHKYGAKLINQRATFFGAGTRTFGEALFSITGTEPYEDVYPSNAEAQDFVNKYNSGDKMKRGGGVGDDQLNIVFSRQDVFEKAKDFYENESAFYPSDVNDEFRTFVFDIENGEADVTEYYMEQELQDTDLDGYYFEIADKMKHGGNFTGKLMGHTKTGKPIYDERLDHHSYDNYTKEDRDDASRAFGKKHHQQELDEKIAKANKMKEGGRAYGLGLKVGSLIRGTKRLGRKGVDATKKAVRDQQKKVALNVIDETKDKVSDNKSKMILKGAEEIVGDKYKKGGPTKAQTRKVGKVMHEFKEGELHSGSKKGPIVTDRKQAVAIALSEAGISKDDKPTGWKHKRKK